MSQAEASKRQPIIIINVSCTKVTMLKHPIYLYYTFTLKLSDKQLIITNNLWTLAEYIADYNNLNDFPKLVPSLVIVLYYSIFKNLFILVISIWFEVNKLDGIKAIQTDAKLPSQNEWGEMLSEKNSPTAPSEAFYTLEEFVNWKT